MLLSSAPPLCMTWPTRLASGTCTWSKLTAQVGCAFQPSFSSRFPKLTPSMLWAEQGRAGVVGLVGGCGGQRSGEEETNPILGPKGGGNGI